MSKRHCEVLTGKPESTLQGYTPISSAVQLSCIKACYPLAVTLALLPLSPPETKNSSSSKDFVEQLSSTSSVQVLLLAEIILLLFASIQFCTSSAGDTVFLKSGDLSKGRFS